MDLDKERGRTLSAQSGALAAAQPHLADLDVRKMDLSSGLREQLEKALNDLNGVRFEVEGGAGAGPGPAEATSKAPSKAKKGKSKESLVLVVQKSQQLQEARVPAAPKCECAADLACTLATVPALP